MKMSRRGFRGEPWSDADVAKLIEMMDDGSSAHWMSLTLNRSISSIEGKIRGIRMTREMGDMLGPGLGRYEAPPFRKNDERKHLQSLFDANGYGFSWWPPSLMERIYLLEKAPPAGKPFWRAS